MPARLKSQFGSRIVGPENPFRATCFERFVLAALVLARVVPIFWSQTNAAGARRAKVQSLC